MVPRPRIARLLEAAWERRVTLVVAGGGYGRTTALRQLAAGNRSRWLGLTAADREVETLAARVADAVGAGTHPAAVGSTAAIGASDRSDGRMWVFWYGQINGKGIIAVTRSNNAVTRFEPIQQYDYNWGSLNILQGDGRLGPLDMVLTGTGLAPLGQQSPKGIYWARVRPQLSASVSVGQLSIHKFKLRVVVTDAGDPVNGATASALGHSKTTNAAGHAKLKVGGSSGESATVTVGAPGYNGVTEQVTL